MYSDFDYEKYFKIIFIILLFTVVFTLLHEIKNYHKKKIEAESDVLEVIPQFVYDYYYFIVIFLISFFSIWILRLSDIQEMRKRYEELCDDEKQMMKKEISKLKHVNETKKLNIVDLYLGKIDEIRANLPKETKKFVESLEKENKELYGMNRKLETENFNLRSDVQKLKKRNSTRFTYGDNNNLYL